LVAAIELLRKKLALSSRPTPANFSKNLNLLLMAFGAIAVFVLAESFLPVVAYPAKLILPMIRLGHLDIRLFHGKDLGVAIRAFLLLPVHMGFMAEGNRVGAAGSKLYISSPDFFRLPKSDAQRHTAKNAKRGNQDFPGPAFQFFASLLVFVPAIQ
jgi:hypothetical protein